MIESWFNLFACTIGRYRHFKKEFGPVTKIKKWRAFFKIFILFNCAITEILKNLRNMQVKNSASFKMLLKLEKSGLFYCKYKYVITSYHSKLFIQAIIVTRRCSFIFLFLITITIYLHIMWHHAVECVILHSIASEC